MTNEQLTALEARVTALENDNEQIWKRMIMGKLDETNRHLAAIALGLLGDVPAGHGQPVALPWMMASDKSHWTAELPDGRTASIERLDDGKSFLPRVGDAPGPVCDGVLSAAQWAAEFAARTAR